MSDLPDKHVGLVIYDKDGVLVVPVEMQISALEAALEAFDSRADSGGRDLTVDGYTIVVGAVFQAARQVTKPTTVSLPGFGHPPVFKVEGGWTYCDETWQPVDVVFETAAEAVFALGEYCAELGGWPEVKARYMTPGHTMMEQELNGLKRLAEDISVTSLQDLPAKTMLVSPDVFEMLRGKS